MTKAYSIDLHKRVIRAVGGGGSAPDAARIFFVSPSSAIKWIQRWRATGSCARSAVRGHRRSPLIDHADWLLALIAGQPDITLEEMRGLMGERGVRPVSPRFGGSSICAGQLQKKALTQPSNSAPTWLWPEKYRKRDQAALDPDKIVFVDETGNEYGDDAPARALQTRQTVDRRAPHGHWKTTTFMAGLRNNAITTPSTSSTGR